MKKRLCSMPAEDVWGNLRDPCYCGPECKWFNPDEPEYCWLEKEMDWAIDPDNHPAPIVPDHLWEPPAHLARLSQAEARKNG